MRVLIQRVSEASVSIDAEIVSAIGCGFLLLAGVENDDTEDDINWLVQKIVNMRIFGDEAGLMNLSIQQVGGAILVVSQFTLHASTKKGNRPSFIKAARPELAIPMYELFCRQLSLALGQDVKTGKFGAEMKVALINDGPVTIWLDSKNKE